MKHLRLFLAALCATLVAACDEGNIPEKQPTLAAGRPIRLDCRLSGIGQWGEGYSVVLALFGDDNDGYDISQFRIMPECDGRDTTIIWELQDASARTLEVCLVSALRERIVTFAATDIPEGTDTIRLAANDIDVGLWATTLAIFNQSCVRCHGEGQAAQLFLDPERAYASLVGHPAHRAEFGGASRVVPGDAQASVLHQMLDETIDNARDLGVNHKAMFRATYPLNIIDLWINSLTNE
ncbi:MAG: hypothetical protein IJS59_04230 [Bacteroidaceae bacterium]|nr:hypothetical protein [Bacteroidaceae bacterium]